MIVAGVGCRRGTSPEEIVSLIFAALARFEIARERLDAIATEAAKADEPGIAGAARCLSMRLIRFRLRSWKGSPHKVVTRSSRSGTQGRALDRGSFRPGRGGA